MVKFVALYLPQYHPIPENNKWYGEGFTEWTNTAKARPLFKGHYQPHIPADLGFYDLRVPEVRRAQARMAQEYGISAFCYWNYWFGNGKQLLEMPIQEVLKDQSISLPFCLGWANHSWEKKLWDDKGTKELLVEQKYLGEEDYIKYFYKMLPVFQDRRYFKIDNRLFFMIWQPLANEELKLFIDTWRRLARKEQLPDFYFIGRDSACRNRDTILQWGYDGVYDDNALNIHHEENDILKFIQLIKRKILHMPTVFEYKDAVKRMIIDQDKLENVIPSIAPNFDHSPRSGKKGFILNDCKPELFGYAVEQAIKAVENKPNEKQVVIIKSWNEWGEGNHLEPDLKYGRGYLEEIRHAIFERKSFNNE